MQIGGDRSPDLAAIKVVRSGHGEAFEGFGETPERQVHRVAVGRTDRRQPIRQPDSPGFFVTPQTGGSACDLERRPPVDRQAGARQGHRRQQQLAPGQAAEPLDRERQTGDRARDREGEGPLDIAVGLDLGPGEQVGARPAGQPINGRIEGLRRHRPEIDHRRTARAGRVDHHEAGAAEPAVPRLDRGERKHGGNHGIDGAAARRQDRGPGFGRGLLLRRHDPSARYRSGLRDLPILRQAHPIGRRESGGAICRPGTTPCSWHAAGGR